MSLELTEAFQQALEAQRGEPVRVVDPRTNETYVLLRADEYDRLRTQRDDNERFAEEMAPLIWEVMKDDWEDPAMAVFDPPASASERS